MTALLLCMALLLPAFSDAPDNGNAILMTRLQTAEQEVQAGKSIGDLVVSIGRTFIGAPYVAKTLDQDTREQLVIRLDAFDCTTFVESVLALARTAYSGKPDRDRFAEELTALRYRQGKIHGYPSRLHYILDWGYDNESLGLLKDVTAQLGGEPFRKEIRFMSDHPQSYPQLAGSTENLEAIRAIEAAINLRIHYFLPKEHVLKTEPLIQNGDIIGITTDIKGLDFVHMGIAVRNNKGDIHLLHASSSGEKVTVSAKPLHQYLAGNKNQSGIVIFRPSEP